MLTGLAALAVRHRALMGVLAGDRGVIEILRAQGDFDDLINRQVKLLADVDPGPAGVIKAAVLLSGIAGAALPGGVPDLDEDALRRLFVEIGRRVLGLRTPRRAAARP
jgi:hypothetical protein